MNALAAAMHVDSVSKTEVCNWFLFWLIIGIAVTIVLVVAFVIILVSGNMAVAWASVPLLLMAVILVANDYFIFAMCSKLPEHSFRVSVLPDLGRGPIGSRGSEEESRAR